MSYVPPHLRNSSSSLYRPSKPSKTSAVTLDDTHRTTNSLSFSSENSHLSHTNASSSPSFSRRPSSNATAMPRTLLVPEPVSPHWKPSDRVFRMKPEQVWRLWLIWLISGVFFLFMLVWRGLLDLISLSCQSWRSFWSCFSLSVCVLCFFSAIVWVAEIIMVWTRWRKAYVSFSCRLGGRKTRAWITVEKSLRKLK